MRQTPIRRLPYFAFITLLAFSGFSARAENLPSTLDDQYYWRLLTGLSEDGGRFQQQLMSNEDSFQSVIPELKRSARKNGVYIGVGSEQNFTYLAVVQPKLAFIVDIRRENMLEHLMYKAIFELSRDRADFLSRLFSRKPPQTLDAGATARELFDAFQPVEPDSSLYQLNLRAVMDRLVVTHKFSLSDEDSGNIARMLSTFRLVGPNSLKGTGDATNPTYAQLMMTIDPAGQNQSFLASEENFRAVQKLENENRIIPLVGDFAGGKAIAGVGNFLKDHAADVDVFYVSNVERYLFDDFAHGKQFYNNLATLPVNSSSTFIRSVTTDISRRLGIALPDGREKWRTFLFSITDCLKRMGDGKIQSYRDLFQ